MRNQVNLDYAFAFLVKEKLISAVSVAKPAKEFLLNLIQVNIKSS